MQKGMIKYGIATILLIVVLIITSKSYTQSEKQLNPKWEYKTEFFYPEVKDKRKSILGGPEKEYNEYTYQLTKMINDEILNGWELFSTQTITSHENRLLLVYRRKL